MTVLLVLMMFAIFLTIDFFYAKAKHPALQVAPAMRKQPVVARGSEAQPGWRLLGSRQSSLSSRTHLGIERESESCAHRHRRLRLEAGWQS